MAREELPGEFRIGDLVELHGLQGARELNGRRGRVVAFMKTTSRLGVRLDVGPAPSAETKLVKPDNLRKVQVAPPARGEDARLDGPMPEAFMRTTPGTPVFRLLLRLLPAEALLALSRCQAGLHAEVQGADEAWELALVDAFGGDLATALRRCPGAVSPRAAFAGLAAARQGLVAVEVAHCDLGNVAALGVEAVVVPANSSLEPYGAAAHAVFERAGPELMAHVEGLERPLHFGTAVWTPGFGTGLQGIVHAVGPNLRTVDGDGRLHEVYASAFARILEHGHRSVAFGSISTGGNGFQAEAAAQIAAEEIRSVLARLGPQRRLRIVIAAFDSEVEEEFHEALKRMRRRANEDLLEVLPIVILDSMLPKQRLTFALDQLPTGLRPELDRFGMVGLRPSAHGRAPLPCGVEVRVRSRRGEQLEVVAGRRFYLPGSLQVAAESEHAASPGRPQLQASVQWASSDADKEQQPGDVILSGALEKSVDLWLQLVRDGRERVPGQMDMVLEDLGPMPPAEELTARALWVCALINPLPALGLAYEVRPAALMARTPYKRLEVAAQGLQESIQRMGGWQG